MELRTKAHHILMSESVFVQWWYQQFPPFGSPNWGVSHWATNFRNDPKGAICDSSQVEKCPYWRCIWWCSEHDRLALRIINVPPSGHAAKFYSNLVWSTSAGPCDWENVQQAAEGGLLLCDGCTNQIPTALETVGKSYFSLLLASALPKHTHNRVVELQYRSIGKGSIMICP